MRIGIDATSWTNWRGFGRFTRSIVEALLAIDRDNEYVLFFDSTYPRCASVPSSARHIVVRTTAAQTEAISVDGRRSAADLLQMAIAAAREPLDVFFCPSIDGYFPIIRRVARVVMIHDVIPETLSEIMLPQAAARWRRRLKVKVAIRQAHILATGSDDVRQQIVGIFGAAAPRVAVIPYGVSARFRPPESLEAARQHVLGRHGVRAPYLLHVGGFGPHKNIPGLLESFATLCGQPQHADVSLVFVGKRDDDEVYDEARRIDTLLEQRTLKNRVLFVGFQPDEELVPLYQAAEALVLVSLTEGFGLPAIEAVCCGTPAIVTSNSPLPAALGDAASVVDPLDPSGIVRAMEHALSDRAARQRPVGRSDQFRWDASARTALTVFRRAFEISRNAGAAR